VTCCHESHTARAHFFYFAHDARLTQLLCQQAAYVPTVNSLDFDRRALSVQVQSALHFQVVKNYTRLPPTPHPLH
jgi:hypothetical protein